MWRYFPGAGRFILSLSKPWCIVFGLITALRAARIIAMPWWSSPVKGWPLAAAIIAMTAATAISLRRAISVRENADDPRSLFLRGEHTIFNLVVLVTGVWWLACLVVLIAA
ncbi:MAG: hypothetical protein D6692_08775 [Planctomycetota bacterium]|nr:MAG: hypothetical protein D6692_08775 [Planctomycetota bacterium]